MSLKLKSCWWLAVPGKKTITKPLINSSFNSGLPKGPSYPVPTIIKELLRQFESLMVPLPNCILNFMFCSLKLFAFQFGALLVTFQ